MKIIKLYTGDDGKSYFKEVDSGVETQRPLGNYSKKYPVSGMLFREFTAGLEFPWHTAPQNQYIIYIEGKVEVQASGGEMRIFGPGDVLLASDLTGAGHITRTLTTGRAIVVEAEFTNEIVESE